MGSSSSGAGAGAEGQLCGDVHGMGGFERLIQQLLELRIAAWGGSMDERNASDAIMPFGRNAPLAVNPLDVVAGPGISTMGLKISREMDHVTSRKRR